MARNRCDRRQSGLGSEAGEVEPDSASEKVERPAEREGQALEG